MTRVLTILFLTLFCLTTHAEWLKLGTSPSGETLYVDPASEQRYGNSVKVWAMYDHSRAEVFNGKSVYSVKDFYHINCLDQTYRLLYQSAHSGRVGDGAVVNTFSKPEASWVPIAPASMIDTLAYVLCKKR